MSSSAPAPGTTTDRSTRRLALYALIICVLAVAAAVVSFVNGSFLGILWVLIAGLASNIAWFAHKRAAAGR
ncbi:MULTISPECIES: hypothetical protein [Streptomyces]|uniref:Uncharacterized protein n=3 Tax=Streptomyces TaxID=1883 RepID=A0A1I6RS98_9ACTN|nr:MULTISPECIES: hypothetical protein [Streptomyces]MCK1814073.1 hypothetical protein [Streptomyces sp. XM4011]QKV68487.1 hypothetical protein HUT13_06585 [Streptomyces harbinensis]UWM48806.1 hypothetical protein N0X72_07080 [Streptomyces carpaticus]SFS67338.1 hypothetical protein SAMN05444716_103317 [Streptomyces harbinensis]